MLYLFIFFRVYSTKQKKFFFRYCLQEKVLFQVLQSGVVLPVIMILEEVIGDLFSAPPNVSLAHCVSADFAMRKGIAKTFRVKFGRVNELVQQEARVGEIAVLRDRERYIYNLVTKSAYYLKPTMQTLRSSLADMKLHMSKNGVDSLCMPQIGSGLDRLNWHQVKRLIEDVFADEHVKIVIYKLPEM